MECAVEGSEEFWRSTSTRAVLIGGYAYVTEFDVERYFRDAPLMIEMEDRDATINVMICL